MAVTVLLFDTVIVIVPDTVGVAETEADVTRDGDMLIEFEIVLVTLRVLEAVAAIVADEDGDLDTVVDADWLPEGDLEFDADVVTEGVRVLDAVLDTVDVYEGQYDRGKPPIGPHSPSFAQRRTEGMLTYCTGDTNVLAFKPWYVA